MIKIYIYNLKEYRSRIGGGFTFVNNFCKGLEGKAEFVDKWQDCDIYFIFGVTAIDKVEIEEAVKAGKKLVMRVDNIPRKSRNKRCSPVERIQEYGKKADLVVYQGGWCKQYAGYFVDNENEVIINNGVDTKIFNRDGRRSDGNTYLYINYNDNPNKRFDEALYLFDMAWRENQNARLIIAGNAPSIYVQNPEYNWDLPTNGKVSYQDTMNSPQEVAELMKRCDYLLYPSAMEAYPNTLLEGMACGLKPVGLNKLGGSQECHDKVRIGGPKSINKMADEYLKEFTKLCQKK